jgi:hypothetical protein
MSPSTHNKYHSQIRHTFIYTSYVTKKTENCSLSLQYAYFPDTVYYVETAKELCNAETFAPNFSRLSFLHRKNIVF